MAELPSTTGDTGRFIEKLNNPGPRFDRKHEAALALIPSAAELIRRYRETRDDVPTDDRHLADAWLIRHRDFLQSWHG